MRQVSQDEFYARVGPLDVVGDCQRNAAGDYETTLKTRYGARIIGRRVSPAFPAPVRFYLTEESDK